MILDFVKEGGDPNGLIATKLRTSDKNVEIFSTYASFAQAFRRSFLVVNLRLASRRLFVIYELAKVTFKGTFMLACKYICNANVS